MNAGQPLVVEGGAPPLRGSATDGVASVEVRALRSTLNQVRAEWRAPAGKPWPLTVLLVKITRLGALTDDYGCFLVDLWKHLTSDAVHFITGHRGKVYCLGEGEYLIVLSGTSVALAKKLAKKVREEVLVRIPSLRETRHPVTLSTGMASGDVTKGSLDDLIVRAYGELDEVGREEMDRIIQSTQRQAVAHSCVLLPDELFFDVESLTDHRAAEPSDWKRPGRVLIVDDDPFAQEIGTNILTNHGYVVQTASSATEAEQVLRQQSFDVIVMDVHLAQANGLDVVAEFRDRNLCGEAAVLVATVDRTRATLFRAFDTGVSGYILKPYRPSLLSDKVAEIIATECVSKELRASRRFLVDMNVTAQPLDDAFQPIDERFSMRALDLSASGIRFTNSEFINCPFLMLWIPLRSGRHLETYVKVLRCRAAGIRYDVGCRFVAPLSLFG